MSFANLGQDVDVVYGPPTDLPSAMCQHCDDQAAIAVADVTWPVRSPHADEELVEGVVCCRGCVEVAVTEARETLTDRGMVAVDVPVWDSSDLIEAAGITSRQLIFWHGRGYLRSEPRIKATSGVPLRFLADEVAHAKTMAALVGHEMPARAADTLSRTRPDVASAVIEALAPSPELVSA
ncbi:hypothetical protein [Actinomycetospora termitidis]|uniref:Uncharacterized protein n=1 Tax=Actinomycetospora termitidis TaxID=3053470 RepID=A0ABT7MGA3_9PSEU|nr:hypothetical protein [Actinomycetospora sp. Odt1-22]MDL5159476.1 hypothetical protein [Actinomycetospora sp. Odt1-22]